MLNQEHLAFRLAGDRVKPRFIDPAAPELLAVAEQFISVYAQAAANGMPRGELAELAGALARGADDVKLASGWNKLLLDRAEFTTPEDWDYPAVRREILLRSGNAWRAGHPPAPPEFDLYGDLPDFETVRRWREITPEQLLHRYNLALAQGLLCRARTLLLTLTGPAPAELRKLLKAVKFFRLLARFTRTDDGVAVEISGPCSLFGPTTRYAMNLANLLPALVTLPRWSLAAEIELRARVRTLKLDQTSGLVSHYRQLAGYIPEEIRLFHRVFAEKSTEWRIVGDTPFLDAGEQEIVFPDLSFRSEATGQIVHVELFHRWHAGQLERRIALLQQRPELPLLLGIERSLVPDSDALDRRLADAPALRDRCWLFRDFPGVETALRALKRFSGAQLRSQE